LAKDPDSPLLATDAAATHCNLGLVLSQAGRGDDAIREFNSAIGTAEPLAQSQPANETALRTLAAAYNNLGLLHGPHSLSDAAEAYRKAIAIQTKLVESNKTNRLYQGDLARTYNNLGFLAARVNDWQKAE